MLLALRNQYLSEINNKQEAEKVAKKELSYAISLL
jgi:hypothetical protein